MAKCIINGTEVSAQEACGFLLGLPNTFSSRQDVYINTSCKLERVGILKPQKELLELPDDSDDICQKGLLEHYVQRPLELEDEPLANFASLYEFSKTKRKVSKSSDDEEGTEKCAKVTAEAAENIQGDTEETETSGMYALLYLTHGYWSLK